MERRFTWQKIIPWGPLGVFLAGLFYCFLYPAKWQKVALDPEQLGESLQVVDATKYDVSLKRDTYSLECNGLIVVRRLLSKLAQQKQIIGEVYTVEGKWQVAKNGHAAAVALDTAHSNDPDIGTPAKPFPIPDGSDWPRFSNFQAMDSANTRIMHVSQFIGGKEQTAKAAKLPMAKYACQ